MSLESNARDANRKAIADLNGVHEGKMAAAKSGRSAEETMAENRRKAAAYQKETYGPKPGPATE